MKNISFAFIAAGLFGLGILPLIAQDAPTRPIQDPTLPSHDESPTPSATANPAPVEKKAEATPTPAPSASPVKAEVKATKEAKPSAKTEKITTASPAPAAIQKASKAAGKARAEKKSVPEIAVGPGNSSTTAAGLKAMEKEWEASFNDPGVIERAVANDFVGTSPDGKLVSKRSLLNDAKTDRTAPPTTVAHSLDVHFYGPNIAVVVGGAKQTDKDRAGHTVRHDYRFTDTWIYRAGKWKCVASQALLLPKR